MNFRRELAEKVMAGEKTVTRRLCSDNQRSPWWVEKCAFPAGKVFAVCPGRSKNAIGHAVVARHGREHLGHLSDAEARREGFPDAAAFEAAFAAINGSYDATALVWRIEFRVHRG